MHRPRGGVTCSSVEAAVMAVERRGDIIQLVVFINLSTENPSTGRSEWH